MMRPRMRTWLLCAGLGTGAAGQWTGPATAADPPATPQPKPAAPAPAPTSAQPQAGATQPEIALLQAFAANPVTAPYRIGTTLRKGRIVLAGRVGTKQAHDVAVRTAIGLGLRFDDDLVIDTAETLRAAVPGPVRVPSYPMIGGSPGYPSTAGRIAAGPVAPGYAANGPTGGPGPMRGAAALSVSAADLRALHRRPRIPLSADPPRPL